jgi:hypothetical protein
LAASLREKKIKNKVSACSNFENLPKILYRKLILTLNIVFKEACYFSSEVGHSLCGQNGPSKNTQEGVIFS